MLKAITVLFDAVGTAVQVSNTTMLNTALLPAKQKNIIRLFLGLQR
jgi:hypothetical protein